MSAGFLGRAGVMLGRVRDVDGTVIRRESYRVQAPVPLWDEQHHSPARRDAVSS